MDVIANFNISFIKKIFDDNNKACVIITNLDEQANHFLKSYYLHKIKYTIGSTEACIIDSVLTKEEFFAPHINILTKRDAYRILYNILQFHGIKPTVEIMYDVYCNKKSKIIPEVYASFIKQIEISKFVTMDKLGRKELDFIASKDVTKNYIYIDDS